MNWNNIKQRMGKQELSESTGIEIFEEQLQSDLKWLLNSLDPQIYC